MPWPKSTVPKFGNWEKNEDSSYSIIFDKVRAEKEMFLHSFEGDPKDTPLDQSFYKNSNIGAGKKTSHSSFSDKAREDRERFLHTQEDKRFTPQHQSVLKNWELTGGRGTSRVSYDKSWELRARDSGNSSPKSPSGGRILGEHRKSSTIQQDPWDLSEAPPYNTSFTSGVPSRQPVQIGATKENSFFKERQCVDQEAKGYHRRFLYKPTNAPGSGRHMYRENRAAAKMGSSQQSSEISGKTDTQGKHTVPKFGDWDSGESFTAAFGRVHNERMSKKTLKPIVKAASPLQPDEDLYKTSEGSTGHKKQRGWRHILCWS